jgi:hypothetical protein
VHSEDGAEAGEVKDFHNRYRNIGEADLTVFSFCSLAMARTHCKPALPDNKTLALQIKAFNEGGDRNMRGDV